MLEAADTPALAFCSSTAPIAAPSRPSRRSRPSASRRSRPAAHPTCTGSRTSSGGTAASSGSSSTARRSARCWRRASRRAEGQHRQPERAAPAPQRRDGVRGARGRRADDGGDQHHDLPRPPPAHVADPRLPARARAEAVLLLQPLRVRQDRRAARLARRPRQRVDRRLRRHGRALARHARRLRPARLLPARTTTTPRTRSGPTPRTRRSAARTRRSPRSSTRPAGRTSSSSATRCCSAPTTGRRTSSASAQLVVDGARVTASNRAAMVYGDDPRALAAALDGEPSVDVALFLEDGEMVARRGGEEDLALLDEHPDGRARAEAALRNPNAGEVIVSAAPGWEFADLGGRHHAGGGSHGVARRAATPRCRCSASAWASRPPRSRRSRRACSSTSGSPRSRAVDRTGWIDRQLRRRGISDERVLAAMARVPRELFVPEELRDYAYEDAALPLAARPDRVAAVHGRRDVPGPRARGRRARARRRHRARATRPRCSPSSRPRCTRSSASRSWPRQRAPRWPRRATAASQVHVGDGWLGLPEHAPYGGIAVAAAAPAVPEALWEQLEPGARIALPIGSRRRQELSAVERTPEGPKLSSRCPPATCRSSAVLSVRRPPARPARARCRSAAP